MRLILTLLICFSWPAAAASLRSVEVWTQQGDFFTQYHIAEGKKIKLARTTNQNKETIDFSRKNFNFVVKTVNGLSGFGNLKDCHRSFIGVHYRDATKDKTWNTCWTANNQSTEKIKVLIQSLDILFP